MGRGQVRGAKDRRKRTRKEKPQSIDYYLIAENADQRILSLFPSLNLRDTGISRTRRNATIQQLACIYAMGKNGPASTQGLSKTLNRPLSTSRRSLKKLSSLSLVEAARNGRTINHSLTVRGAIALTSFKDFQSFPALKPLLTDARNRGNKLAYALLLIGYSANDKPGIAHEVLAKFAEQGGNLEAPNNDAQAESILNLYSDELKSKTSSPSNYLSMFREFTTAGFQDILRMLLSAMKPTLEDYNWLVQFFHELVEFYYDPVRMAYMSILSQNPEFRRRLDQFKATQEQRTRTEGLKMELTFVAPRGPLLQRFMSMPPHLRVMGIRLMLEPLQFMAQELNDFFWPPRQPPSQR